MAPKKKKRIKNEKGHLERFGIFEDDEESDEEAKDEKESWRDVG